MGCGTLLPSQTARLTELCEVAGKMTDPERGRKKNPRAVVKISFWDGFPREFSLELAERTVVDEEVKQKKPGG